MIIIMKQGANKLMVSHIATSFEKAGFDVQIKNSRSPYVIAVLGIGLGNVDLSNGNFPGIDKVILDNTFFNEHHNEFVLRSEFLP